MRNGILVGGNWIIDQVKLIDTYPQEEKLVNILAEFSSNGGSAYNILKDLYKMRVCFPLEGIGLVGEDERGQSILNECIQMGIDVRQLKRTNTAATSYTDVMSVQSTGKRTFFHNRGANALLDESCFDFSISQARIFHLGYLLLLDKLDSIGEDGLTGAAHVFKKAKEAGFITSADIVSENTTRFKEIIPFSLPFVDYLFINEFEAKMLTGTDTCTDSGEVSVNGCYEAAERILEMGVSQWVILHFPKGVIAVNKTGETLFQPSLNLDPAKVVGAVGAGDAFAAGVLTGIHDGWNMQQCLELGVCAAGSSLFGATSSDSILSREECLHLVQQYGFKKELVEV
jgi:sugar/nucleoside kinase (ribokinase family)